MFDGKKNNSLRNTNIFLIVILRHKLPILVKLTNNIKLIRLNIE